MNKKAGNIIKYALSAVLAVVLVYFAFRGVDWKAFWTGLGQTRWAWIVLYFIVALLALFFREERWYALIRPLDPEVRRMQVWDAINVGNIINIVLPGAGEFARCGYVSSKRMGYDKALGTIVCERLCDVVAIVVLLVTALCLKWESFGPFFAENVWAPMAGRLGGSLVWLLAGVVLLLAAFFWAVFRFRDRVRLLGRIAEWLLGLGAGFASVARMENKFSFLLTTVGIWIMYVLMFWCTIRALPDLDSLGMADALFLSAIGNMASVIPVPGGIGAYHYLVALSIQSLYALSWDTGILVATLGHEAHAILIIIVGVISYVHLSLRKKK
ncbi:MAG: flippase-like domain-containing protein [Bacteroidales bacterium]|nr:flippase-like domain-containing protein [Bacteroidales bacterium]